MNFSQQSCLANPVFSSSSSIVGVVTTFAYSEPLILFKGFKDLNSPGRVLSFY